MNRLCVFLCMLLMLVQYPAEARQVRVLNDAIEFTGPINTIQRKSLLLQNESSSDKTYTLKFLRGNIGSSQNLKLCIGDNCYNLKKDVGKINLNLKAGELITDLYLEFELGITETKGTFDLHFSNVGNPRDVFILEAVYNVINGDSGNEVQHKDIAIGAAYPNPSNNIAQIDYELKNPNAHARIVVNSFIGNPVYDFLLDPRQNSLVINVADLNPGVYFYTLIVDNKNIVTKKLVVKK
ncbi:T9SS type A sorting domain-containing protein [Litoribacter ruber]|uniref:T9SS type A sorting domain-containing protein n=1 Tax=Litoribacter ruber TaxID=702568 RepID=A0AAP2CG85_9BACT|nr:MULTISPECIES: T9SS type A sorting domain-containing protein [Litoribacter]MBS9522611.1 T9SS type A sorting domain-containing protein [Litoribacter alkaliphilus]MBT0811140.1 T9SS type A sorting domain-containing protein [Litoribacter ruber]